MCVKTFPLYSSYSQQNQFCADATIEIATNVYAQLLQENSQGYCLVRLKPKSKLYILINNNLL
jgi:hypothetical protein